MARYRLTHPCHCLANGLPRPKLFAAGEEIEFEGVPSVHMQPLDDNAEAAVAARRVAQPYEPSKNGVQAIDVRTGKTKVTKFENYPG